MEPLRAHGAIPERDARLREMVPAGSMLDDAMQSSALELPEPTRVRNGDLIAMLEAGLLEPDSQ